MTKGMVLGHCDTVRRTHQGRRPRHITGKRRSEPKAAIDWTLKEKRLQGRRRAGYTDRAPRIFRAVNLLCMTL